MSNKKAKVLFICKQRNSIYGISVGLVNSAQFIANYLNANGYESKVVIAFDANAIDREVYLYKPTHVIIHALWVPPAKMEVLAQKYPKIQWQIRIHSKVPFIAHEGIAMEWITGYYDLQKCLPNIQISANSEEFKTAIELSLKNHVEYLPNLYMPSYPPPPIVKHSGNYLNVGCFGAIRPFKNHLLQGMAAMTFGDKIKREIRFHINSDRSEQNGQSVLKNLQALFASSNKHKLIEVKWQEHKDFLSTIAQMDMGMQISLSETYNIVAGDFVYVGIPIIVSPEIDWMPFYAKANPYDIESMVSKLESNLHINSKFTQWINRKYLNEDTEAAGKVWVKYLKK
jgi:hypothetical protein